MKDSREQTYYELLEIETTASQEDILKAYNRARATYSSNNPALYSLFDKKEAQELLKLIDEAFSVLGSQAKRKQYDLNHLDQNFSGESPLQTKPPLKAKKNLSTPYGEYVKDAKFEDEIRVAEEFSGSFIQKIRLYKNITVDQISESVKISRAYLLAIETNNFASLPAPVFVRGFLVQIAKVLSLDPNKVATSYMKQLKDAQKK